MKNVALCFLAVLMFAPSVALSAGAARSTVKDDAAADSVRLASSGRAGGARVATQKSGSRTDTSVARERENVVNRDMSRVDKPAARSGADVVMRTVNTKAKQSKTTQNVASRTINKNSVVLHPDKQRDVPGVKKRTITAQPVELNENARYDNLERGVADRAAKKTSDKKVTAQDVATAKELLEQNAALNKSCQEQYNECMDQFCSVVDTNQKRCSCSANLSKYTDAQAAVTKANNELNEVAQRIRYVGLSADEIHAIMTETEAEAELDSQKDTSETRSMLTKIESLIKDPTSRVDMAADNDFGLELDLDFSAESADMFSLDFLNNKNESISSKRGTALYNAAAKRCKTILNNCVDVGATQDQITGNYDLAIDKDCIAYEQGLKKMNQTLQSNVRSAGLMLQKARLAVLQNKNQYDPKGCISALETCMTDEMVCGEGYVKCLDPTKKYIDENGNVVLGQNISNITNFMREFNSGSITDSLLADANGVSIDDNSCKTTNNDGRCLIKMLLNKIGTGATVKDGGLCRAVLDKCQQYTYTADGKYKPYNDVVVNYVQRAMVNIKAAQHQIISDYASTCITDVASCYNQQVTSVNAWSTTASVASIHGIMTGACRNVALTCGYAVFADMCSYSISGTINWVLQAAYNQGGANLVVGGNPYSCLQCDETNPGICLEGISEMFYQSLLCPENSTYTPTVSYQDNTNLSGYVTSGGLNQCVTDGVKNRKIAGCVNKQCKCNDGYTAWNGTCVAKCAESDKYRNEYGACATCPENTRGHFSATATCTDSGTCEYDSCQ